ncbi:unnamed protein product [Arabidopsis halleri]
MLKMLWIVLERHMLRMVVMTMTLATIMLLLHDSLILVNVIRREKRERERERDDSNF